MSAATIGTKTTVANMLSRSSSNTTSTASSSSSSFNEENFLRKLEKVTPTQESIQSFALWIIHHKNAHEVICKLWLKKLNECEF